MANAEDEDTSRADIELWLPSDLPDQRRAYADLRTAAAELREEGYNRLGPKLYKALELFLSSLPEPFEDARAYPVWREGDRLRRLYGAHLKADEDEIVSSEGRLEREVSTQLGNLVRLFNYFAFHDQRLRGFDESRTAPQERDPLFGEAELVNQLKLIVSESGEAEGFDAAEWLSRWLREPLPALSGETPLSLLNTMEGHAIVSNALARIQSGAYA